MLTAIFHIRFVSLLAVIAAMLGALLMFLSGSLDTFLAYRVFFGFLELQFASTVSVEAAVYLLAALDHFLFGLVLLYFGYGIYFLFIKHEAEEVIGENVKMPSWLKVQSLGQMKKTMLEVIVVLLAVQFFKVGLATETQTELNWESRPSPHRNIGHWRNHQVD